MEQLVQAQQLANELLDDIELSRLPIDRLIMKATRLARITEDEVALTWLAFETTGCTNTKIGRLHMTRTKRWLDQKKGTGHWMPATAIQASLESHTKTIDALKVDSVSGEWASVALREQRNAIISLSTTVNQYGVMLAHIGALIHDFAARVHHELQFSGEQARMFEALQLDVDARLARLGGEALTKIDSINERFRTGDTEAVSHAMNTARRLIDSVADSVFPGRPEPYLIGEDPMIVDDSKHLNRINAFLHSKGASDGQRVRLRRTLGDIYGRASKGVHDDIDINEARFLFLQTYISLGEVVFLA